MYQEDENKEAPTALQLIEASLRREDIADQTNFRYAVIIPCSLCFRTVVESLIL